MGLIVILSLLLQVIAHIPSAPRSFGYRLSSPSIQLKSSAKQTFVKSVTTSPDHQVVALYRRAVGTNTHLCASCDLPVTAGNASEWSPCAHSFHRNCLETLVTTAQSEASLGSCPKCSEYLRFPLECSSCNVSTDLPHGARTVKCRECGKSLPEETKPGQTRFSGPEDEWKFDYVSDS